MRALLYTSHDGGVSVCHPKREVLRFMTGGGGYWSDRPRGFLSELVRRKTCPILQNGKPITQAAALRFVDAMQWGGCTDAEAWEVIAGHDCERFGHSVALIDTDDLPSRLFRDAWKRGNHEQHVYVDLAAARKIQLARIEVEVMKANKRALALQRGKVIKPKWGEIERAIARASSAEELASVRAC